MLFFSSSFARGDLLSCQILAKGPVKININCGRRAEQKNGDFYLDKCNWCIRPKTNLIRTILRLKKC